MASPAYSFTKLFLLQWRDPSSSAKTTLAINGRGLTIANVVAVSRDLAHVELTSDSVDAIEVCSKIILEKITKGNIIYGVDTGFGGSADMRSDDVERAGRTRRPTRLYTSARLRGAWTASFRRISASRSWARSTWLQPRQRR
ncbi:hypothetical protein F4782DRAFT_510034 [Xylaria castorea]|nr:hypothetical protein F4782DRAFT_510034 [Xylaria castorea]